MDTSIFLARLIGPMMLAVGAGLLIDQRAFKEMAAEFLASRTLLFLSGFLTLLGGLAIVNTHNVWELGWPVIITIIGWLAVIGGTVRIVWPSVAKSVGNRMLERAEAITAAGGFNLLLGVFLCYMGYLA